MVNAVLVAAPAGTDPVTAATPAMPDPTMTATAIFAMRYPIA
jgi:hypothetical protein